MNNACAAYQYFATDKKCNIWDGDYLEDKKGEPEGNNLPKGSGTGAGECHIKEKAGMTEVEYLKNDDEDGMFKLPGSSQGPLYALFPTAP